MIIFPFNKKENMPSVWNVGGKVEFSILISFYFTGI